MKKSRKKHYLINSRLFKQPVYRVEATPFNSLIVLFSLSFYSLVYELCLSRDYRTGIGHAQVLGSSIPDRGSGVMTWRETLQVSPHARGLGGGEVCIQHGLPGNRGGHRMQGTTSYTTANTQAVLPGLCSPPTPHRAPFVPSFPLCSR